tara:strand:- start:73743 stop:74939 length:1197 start_codon:yes stop_codon:yes gene_type:complete
MMIKPKVRGFICTTAHPEGCATHVQQQIDYMKQHPISEAGPKKVLVIGASTGYGLASRITAAFGYGAQTIGVFFEREASDKRTATAGWYNTVAFENAAHTEGLYAKSINGDAFSDEIKQQTIDMIKTDWQGEVDLVIYSLASPRRTHPKTGEVFNAVLKTIGEPFSDKNVNVFSGEVSDINIGPANEEEIANTVAVMGGEDWKMWIDALSDAGVLADGVKTVAYNYIGPEVTYPIYHQGTIGNAKTDLENTANKLDKQLQAMNGHAYISVNKALVTQASSAIPVVPLYISLLYKVMKEKKIHEGCIEQMWRLFSDRLYHGDHVPVDDKGFIRVDDWEMRDDVQEAVKQLWQQANTDNLMSISDLEGYRHEFYRLFGFDLDGIDYDADVEPNLAIASIK